MHLQVLSFQSFILYLAPGIILRPSLSPLQNELCSSSTYSLSSG